MTQRTLFFVAGARPNFMKIAPILRALNQAPGNSIHPFLVHTGQHYDEGMSDIFFEQLGIPRPDVQLNVGSASHGVQTARVLESFEKLLLEREKPTAIVVVGDVNSTFACALAASKLRIPIVHVEAGLRSFDRTMPEEINRVLTDAISDLLLITEESARTNLMREGIDPSRIRMVGNVMIDTLLAELPKATAFRMWERVGASERGYAVVTLHRPSNVDDREQLSKITSLLVELAQNLKIIFPVHPRTKRRLEEYGLLSSYGHPNIAVLEPLGYHETLSLLSSARLVLTDSGGVQEETSALGVPCLTLRPNTERPVTVELGTNTIVGSDFARAEFLVHEILEGRYKNGQSIPFWDGCAAQRVVKELRKDFAG